MYTHSFSTQTGTRSKRQRGELLEPYKRKHSHDTQPLMTIQQARHSKYAEWICETRSYLHIHLYSKQSRSTSRASIHKVWKSSGTDLRSGLKFDSSVQLIQSCIQGKGLT